MLEQSRRRSPFGDGPFQNIETVFVHMDRGEGTRFISICDLKEVSFDVVRDAVVELREFASPVDEIPRCVKYRAS